MGSNANELRLGQVRAKVSPLGAMIFFTIDVLLAASIWGHSKELIEFAGIFVASAVFNLPVCNWLIPRFGVRAVEWSRVVANTLTCIALCHLCGWGFAGLAALVLIGVAQGTSAPPDARWHGLLVAGLACIVAYADGLPGLAALTLGIVIQGGFWLAHASASVGIHALEKLDAEHRELTRVLDELRRLQRSAIQQEKLAGLGLLAAGIAHEINNPMSWVTSNVDDLLRDLREVPNLPPTLQEYANEVLPETVVGIRRVNAIVADLRRFAREDVEGPREYDLNDEIRGALRLTQSQMKTRCPVELELKPLPRLMGRPGQITQVLVNLLVNAAQAIPDAGVVTIRSETEGEGVKVSVRDTGVGMSPETLQHLFEPFFTTKPFGEGTGLGLAVAHGIVVAHGGAIEVESAPGRGSTFTVRLPRSPPQPGPKSTAESEPGRSLGNPRTLVLLD